MHSSHHKNRASALRLSHTSSTAHRYCHRVGGIAKISRRNSRSCTPGRGSHDVSGDSSVGSGLWVFPYSGPLSQAHCSTLLPHWPPHEVLRQSVAQHLPFRGVLVLKRDGGDLVLQQQSLMPFLDTTYLDPTCLDTTYLGTTYPFHALSD